MTTRAPAVLINLRKVARQVKTQKFFLYSRSPSFYGCCYQRGILAWPKWINPPSPYFDKTSCKTSPSVDPCFMTSFSFSRDLCFEMYLYKYLLIITDEGFKSNMEFVYSHFLFLHMEFGNWVDLRTVLTILKLQSYGNTLTISRESWRWY